jgi:hypothetical protein
VGGKVAKAADLVGGVAMARAVHYAVVVDTESTAGSKELLAQEIIMTTTTRIDVALSLTTRRTVREAADASRPNLPVEVVDGASGPRECGHSWHYETRGGTRIDHPSAYARTGWSNMVYCHSTRRVEVGREWLVAHGLLPAATLAA